MKNKNKELDLEDNDQQDKGDEPENINDRKHGGKYTQYEGENIYEMIQIITKKKSLNDQNFIITCLKNHFVFYNLNDGELENIVKKMFYCEVATN